MLEIGGLLSVSNLHGIKLPSKTFRRAAKTAKIAAPTFIRAMCATQCSCQ